MRNRGSASKEVDEEAAPLLKTAKDGDEKKKKARGKSPARKPKKRVTPFKVSARFSFCTYFNPIAWGLILLDIFLIIVTFKWVGLCRRKSPRVVEKPGKVKRHVKSADALVDNAYGCKTAYEVCSRAFTTYASKQCMGTRTFLGMHTVPGERFPRKKFGATTWQTFREVGDRAHAFGAGLIKIGLVSLPKTEGQRVRTAAESHRKGANDFEQSKGCHTLLIYEETCADWMTALMGAFSQSLCVATSYATLGPSAVADAVNQCNVKAVLCNFKDVEKLAAMKDKMPSLTHIVYTKNYVTASDLKRVPRSPRGVTILSMDEVVDMGKAAPLPPNPPTPDNMAVIMYTSGSTGKPKGVMIRQRNIVASAGMFLTYVRATGFLLEGEETYIAYLPAAHIMELCVEFAMLGYGGRIGYSDVRSFSSAGACRVNEKTGELHLNAVMKYPDNEAENFAPGGLQSFRPTFMIAVPKIWDILKKGVEEKVTMKPGVVKALVQLGFAWRNWLLKSGMDSVLFNALFRKVFVPILGGRQKLFATGGGPISGEVQSFVRTMFGCALVQGYALTESCCAGTIQCEKDPRDGVVGPPVASVEIKLRDCVTVCDRNSKPYLSTDRSHYGEACDGRGEVLIRGPSVSSGYLKQPEKTQKEFDKDGWFHTGDIAIFTRDGCIKIVDRLKNLVKLKGGEYIAIESMEKEYSKSIFVDGKNGGLMCYGDGDMDRPVALVQANIPDLRRWAVSQGLDFGDDAELCDHPKVLQMVLDDLNREGKRGGVGRNEKLCAVHLIPGDGSKDKPELRSPWTPENGYLTASNKLQRKKILMGLEPVMKKLKQKGVR